MNCELLLPSELKATLQCLCVREQFILCPAGNPPQGWWQSRCGWKWQQCLCKHLCGKRISLKWAQDKSLWQITHCKLIFNDDFIPEFYGGYKVNSQLASSFWLMRPINSEWIPAESVLQAAPLTDSSRWVKHDLRDERASTASNWFHHKQTGRLKRWNNCYMTSLRPLKWCRC